MSGWTTATIKTDKKQSLEKNLNYIVTKREDTKKLNDNTIGVGGYGTETIRKRISEIVINAKLNIGDQILLIEANNTTDSGIGYLYRITGIHQEKEEIEIVKVDEKQGHEGANARDVTGYFRDNHDINGRANLH